MILRTAKNVGFRTADVTAGRLRSRGPGKECFYHHEELPVGRNGKYKSPHENQK